MFIYIQYYGAVANTRVNTYTPNASRNTKDAGVDHLATGGTAAQCTTRDENVYGIDWVIRRDGRSVNLHGNNTYT